MADKEMGNHIRLKGEEGGGGEESLEKKLKTPEEVKAEEEDRERRQVQRLLAETVAHSMPMDDVKLILKYGGDVNRPVNRGMMPLHYAAYANNLDAMKHFIELGCDVNAKNKEGHTPVHTCAKRGNHKCLKYLIQHGAHVNIDNKEYTPMPRKKSVMLVEDTLADTMENGITISKLEAIQEFPREEDTIKPSKDDESETALSSSECNGYTATETDIVCDASDDSSEYISRDATVEPINLALENNHVKVVKLLLESGANPNRRYFMGYEINLLPLKNIECLDLLLKYGANPNCVNRLGFTPLMMAAKQNETQALRLLIKKGADVNQQRPERFEQKTALHIALEAGNLSVTRTLLLQHARVSRCPNYEYNALHTAVLTDRVDLVELVLCFPQDVDETTDDDCSALMLAAASTELKNQFQIIKLLLQTGANPNFHAGVINYIAPCLSPLVEYLMNNDNIDYDIVFMLIQYGAQVNFAGASTVFRKKDPYGVLSYIPKIRKNIRLLKLLIKASSFFDVYMISKCKEVTEDERKWLVALGSQPFSLKNLVRHFLRKQLLRPFVEKIKNVPLPENLIKDRKSVV